MSPVPLPSEHANQMRERARQLVIRDEALQIRRKRRLERCLTLYKKVRLNVLDQALSSASNFLLVLMVARTATVHVFGGFSLVYLLYGLVLGAIRAAGGDVLLTKTRPSMHGFEGNRRSLLGLAVVFGTIIGILLIALSFLFSGTSATSLAALGATLPALLLQDCMRYYFFAGREAGRAAVVDGIWLLLQVAAFIVIAAVITVPSPSLFLLVWGVCAALAALAGSVWWRIRPRFRHLGSWFHKDAGRSASFLADFAFMIGAGYIYIYLIGAILGLGAVAGIRGAQQLYFPFQTIIAAIRVVSLPAFTAANEKSTFALRSAVGRVFLLIAFAAVVWGGLALAVPDRLGVQILGDTWHVAKPLLLILAVANLARMSAIPLIDGIRALGGGKRLVYLRFAASVLILLAVIVGATIGGVLGAATGLTIGTVLSTALWSIGFITIRKEDSSAHP
jgi:O-antigen/teichoic acid export membrane protein